MKLSLSTILPGALFAMEALAEPTTDKYIRVLLEEPQKWVAGSRLFPGNVIAGYNAGLGDYNAESWSNYVFEKCKSFDQCTSSLAFSAINSGTPKTEALFGYVFRGGPTTQKDYKRVEGVKNSVAYSIVKD
ncbi:unnamed protein product [Clonostachys rosea]|uniref:Uncharacterized protein n=1 Tax=Bionectria ochroleuca TaxID=29856 RepID=A0ABY6UND7_BIOOC|nr:unnamed protein product [Clonostachys rosea]